MEPYLEQAYNLSVTKIGYTFLGLSVPYFFASPFWGYACDHWVNPKIIQPIGHVFTIIGFLLIGPVGYIPETVSTMIYKKYSYIFCLILQNANF